jgi:hypothetical protein
MIKKSLFIAMALGLLAGASHVATAQTTGSISSAEPSSAQTFSSEEVLSEAHQFFGKASRDLAEAVESVFDKQGEPTAYIVGEEAAGSFIGGLRYGEGTIYYKSGLKQRIYWQGPSVGFDFGGNGSRSLVLVYHSQSPEDIHGRFGGVEGSAYFVGGVGVNFQQRDEIILAPIRSGVGARLGANVGYLKYSAKPDWNPF